MPPNTDRPINRAMVVGCAVSATRNHLKLHEPRTLKILSCATFMPKRESCGSILLAPRPPSRSPPTYDPHSTRCTAGCHTSRDFVHWRFSDAGHRSAWIASSCRRPKTCTVNGRSTVRDLAKSGQHNQAMHRTIYRTRSRQRTTQDSAQLHESGCAMGYRTVRREPNR